MVGANGLFCGISFFALDSSDSLYVYESVYFQKLTSTGSFVRKFNGESTGGFAIDSSGNYFSSDSGVSRVKKYNSTGVFQFWFGGFGTGNGQFNDPGSLVIDSSGNIYVIDKNNCRVQVFDSAGSFLWKFGSCGTSLGQFTTAGSIQGLARDTSGNIYVGDQTRVLKFDSTGAYQSQIGSRGSALGQFLSINSIVVDANGFVYVLDSALGRLQKFSAAGVVQTD